jgi:hypothetical protein
MGFMDKVVSKAQEVGKAGQAKVDEVQVKRQVEELFRQVGSLTYAASAGHPGAQDAEHLEQAMGKLRDFESTHPQLFASATAGTFSGPGGAPVAVVPTAFSGAGSVPGAAAAAEPEPEPEA